MRAIAPYLVKRGGGRIIVTSSTQGRHGTKEGSAYSALKWGIIGLMKSAALELGSHKITVNAVIPGLIDTPLTRHESRYAQALETAGQKPTGDEAKDEQAVAEAKTKSTPLGVPWLAPEDVAPVVVFLASDEARMVSGATYDVGLLQGKSWQDIASALQDPNSGIAKGALGAANWITAAICKITNDKPGTACSSNVIQGIEAKLG